VGLISHKKLCDILKYDPVIGRFIWKVDRGPVKCEGKIAGSYTDKGYRVIVIDKKIYKEHRLAWFYHHKKWPENQLDHINRIKDDNRIENLRECVNSENCQNRNMQSNNTSGYTGVNWSKQCKKWRAEICVNNKNKYLGLFENFDDAIIAYDNAKKLYHDFVN
jgi:hypothetical protein